MGGKSTLLRATCLAVVIAQLGSCVPADSYIATLFDRLFTRIGAHDNLLQKKSTFFLEMEETNTILQRATKKSLVVIDELGRGTSTFDGLALAKAVLNYLALHNKGLVMFTTHYRWLVNNLKNRPEFGLKTMLCCKQPNGEI